MGVGNSSSATLNAEGGGLGTVVVTGAQGFLGRYLVSSLLRSGAARRVIGVGRSARNDTSFTHSMTINGAEMWAPLPDDLLEVATHDGYAYQAADLTSAVELADFFAGASPDAVIHSAAALRDESAEDLLSLNLRATLNLFEGIGALGDRVPRVVLVSSGSVYGFAESDSPRSESDICDPVDLYAASKLASEHVARVLARTHSIPTMIGRAFNLTGPGLQERHFPAKVAHFLATCENAEDAPEDLVVGRLDTRRDLVDVRDAADAIVALALRGEPGQRYNVGSGRSVVMSDVLVGLIARCTRPPRVVHGEGRPADVESLVADIARLERLGFDGRFTLDQTLDDLMAYARACAAER